MKDKIDEVCANLELGCIDWEEASKQLFDLFVVSHQRELLFCGGCGNKKRGIVETDVNSQTVCKNKLCKQNNCG